MYYGKVNDFVWKEGNDMCLKFRDLIFCQSLQNEGFKTSKYMDFLKFILYLTKMKHSGLKADYGIFWKFHNKKMY